MENVFEFPLKFYFYGKNGSLRFGTINPKKNLLNNIDTTFDLIHDVQFNNRDFRKFLKAFELIENKLKTFIYCDPPYLNTGNNYSNSFTEKDTKDLFEVLINRGCKFAISEFDNPVILDLAEQYNLNVITIGERRTLKNRRIEILITNYKNIQLNLFDK